MLFLLRQLRRLELHKRSGRYFIYAIGETVLIVVGILIAVQIGDWKEGRKNRAEERQILTRIVEEMDAGLGEIARYQPVFEQKHKDLNQVLSILRGAPIEDESNFLRIFARSTNFTWTQKRFPSATYEEITSSGKMGLIRNVELRNEIATLYRESENVWRMLDVRRGEYPKIAYNLLLREGRDFAKENMSPEEISSTVAAILGSELEEAVIFELNRNNYAIFTWEHSGNQMEDLRNLIQAELNN